MGEKDYGPTAEGVRAEGATGSRVPFIATARWPCPACQYGPNAGGEHRPESVKRMAFATAEEARQVAADVMNEHRYEGEASTSPMVEPCEYDAEDFEDLINDELRGRETLGPFHDGSTISFEPSNWTDLAEPYTPTAFMGEADILAHFNDHWSNR